MTATDRVRTVDVHVRRLRAKLGTDHESMVDTVRGVGYMAVTPPQPQMDRRRAGAESRVGTQASSPLQDVDRDDSST